MHEGELVAFMMTLIVVAGAGLMIAAMFNRRKMREMVHRERLAMIDRGLIPSPESDPGAFENAAGVKPRRPSGATNFRTSGVILIGLGLGMMVRITFTAGNPRVGVGVGGAWMALGAALLLNYFLLTRREEESDLNMPAWPPPSRPIPRDPPANGAP